MKKIIIALFLITSCVYGSAQMHTSISIGTTKNMPLGALQFGYIFKKPYILNWGVEYDQRFFLSRIEDYGAYFGTRITGTYYLTPDQTLTALSGGYYLMKSSDYPQLNGWAIGYGVKYKYKSTFLELYHLSNRIQVSVGIHYDIVKKY